MEPAIRQFIKKYPKLKGYRFNGIDSNERVANLANLEKNFKESEVVSPKTLIEKRIIRRIKGRVPKVKILGTGELKKKLVFEKCTFSKTAQKKLDNIK